MAKIPNTRTAVIIGNIKQIMTNAKKRAMFTFRIDAGKGAYYLIGNTKISESEMDVLYPIEPKRKRLKGINPDRTKIE